MLINQVEACLGMERKIRLGEVAASFLEADVRASCGHHLVSGNEILRFG